MTGVGRHTHDMPDAAAFGAWVAPHLPALSRYAHRLVPAAAADDVVQEALVRAWSRQATYVRPEARRPWLLAIVADQARRHRRELTDPPAGR
jgi:RNA polymerase sigma-70 factor (ECF subfamily)